MHLFGYLRTKISTRQSQHLSNVYMVETEALSVTQVTDQIWKIQSDAAVENVHWKHEDVKPYTQWT